MMLVCDQDFTILVMINEAKNLFEQYIFSQVKTIPNLTQVPLEKTGLVNEFFPSLEMTHFDDRYDTLIYSELICKALELSPEVSTILDLGAGSSIPTLLALKKSGRLDVSTIAVDIDEEALEVGKRNAQWLGLSDQYTFWQADIQSVLRSPVAHGPKTLIVSNPPYIPTPLGITDHYFTPINGGEDGSRYILKTLEQDYLPGTIIALLWGSLTSPFEILPLIEERFEILHQEAHRIHFGKYTSRPVIHQHLEELLLQGRIFFEKDDKWGAIQYVFGTILKSKS
jgi:SAM-dependent methyltransferase